MSDATTVPTHRRRMSAGTWTLQIAVLAAAVAYMFPIYILINLSLKPPGGSAFPLEPAVRPTLENFFAAWNQALLGPALINSTIVTAASTIIVVICASLAAYPLARSTSRWSSATYYAFILGMIIPFQLAMVPLYTTFRDLGLLGTLPAMIIFYGGAQLPFAVFMYTTFMRNMQREYEEAAEIDGCGQLGKYWHIVLPMSRPITGTVVILTGIHVWNDFFAPLIYLSGGEGTVPIALYGFVGTYYAEWNLVFAGLILSALPLLIVYFAMQKNIIQGFAGGLKG
ncbi:sugar ABC transporter permease [Acrocarpospora pleiomorpha]|uniref:Sugar ABC transporter permease n=1 Tax=Acrocarpospora pleiomorpha TaxID=90975 RepID=A0A5M3XSU5_9ACTN|nr:carbohydrate ABC transporter permease [Acrocarpospora pleiomorpha]GES23900.1 sugar ABC transporter permease [Acrocarpospora pleiomorpha]